MEMAMSMVMATDTSRVAVATTMLTGIATATAMSMPTQEDTELRLTTFLQKKAVVNIFYGNEDIKVCLIFIICIAPSLETFSLTPFFYFFYSSL